MLDIKPALVLPRPELGKRKLLIVTPVGARRIDIDHAAAKRAVSHHFASRALCPVSTLEWGGAGLNRARNTFVEKFRQDPDATDLFQWDSDLAIPASALESLLRAPFDVVGIAYPLKEINWPEVVAFARAGVPADALPWLASGLCLNFTPEQFARPIEVEGVGTFLEVDAIGAGLMMLRKTTVERFLSHYRDAIAYQGVPGYDPAPTMHRVFADQRDPGNDTPTGRELSEDYAFCRRWRMMGGKVHCLVDVPVSHAGTHTFKGNLGLQLSIAQKSGQLPKPP